MQGYTGSSELEIRVTQGAKAIQQGDGSWRLSLPVDNPVKYQCSQLDDYYYLNRKDFPWKIGSYLSLEARVSSSELTGTWGFGFWNDPFQVKMGIKGVGRRLPTLPNTAWFFYASPPNYLAFRDDHPAQGMLSSVFSGPALPAWVFSPAVPFIPLLGLPYIARILRKQISIILQEDATQLDHDVTCWNRYEVNLGNASVDFKVNERLIWSSKLLPKGKLGIVIWIDNQFASFTPDGKIKSGLSPVLQDHWMEVRNIQSGCR